MDLIDVNELLKLYIHPGKHSCYQSIPQCILSKLNIDYQFNGKYENERLEYILSKINVKSKTILDIGGNTGFFSIEFLERGANYVEFYEYNTFQTKFVEKIIKILKFENKILINNSLFNFDKIPENKFYDITLLLNVLHHIGDDFGKKNIDKENALKKIGGILRSFSKITNYLIFQMGFNWKGNINLPLFKSGTKKEMIDFITTEVKDTFIIKYIGIAEKRKNKIKYYDLNNRNIKRMDELGEFLNRPIFIMKNKKNCGK